MTFCANSGGFLVDVLSEQENNVIRDMLAGNNWLTVIANTPSLINRDQSYSVIDLCVPGQNECKHDMYTTNAFL